MTWFEITLTHEQISKGELIALNREIESVGGSLGDREELIVLIGKMREKGVTFFFGPSSLPYISHLLSRYGGILREKPSLEDIDSVLSGDREAALALLLED